MPSLREQLITDLAKTRHGFGPVDAEAVTLRSPACGDEITVSVTRRDRQVTAMTWRGHGCTIAMASASALAAITPGLNIDQLRGLREEFSELLRAAPPEADPSQEDLLADELPASYPQLGDAVAFVGVGRLPLRAGCATLAWEALMAALAQPGHQPGSGH